MPLAPHGVADSQGLALPEHPSSCSSLLESARQRRPVRRRARKRLASRLSRGSEHSAVPGRPITLESNSSHGVLASGSPPWPSSSPWTNWQTRPEAGLSHDGCVFTSRVGSSTASTWTTLTTAKIHSGGGCHKDNAFSIPVVCELLEGDFRSC
jgi:hypothetical protein